MCSAFARGSEIRRSGGLISSGIARRSQGIHSQLVCAQPPDSVINGASCVLQGLLALLCAACPEDVSTVRVGPLAAHTIRSLSLISSIRFVASWQQVRL